MRTFQVKRKSGLGRALTGATAAAALLMTASPAFADFEVGLEAYRSGQYDVALDLWERYAVAGDVRSMKALGDYYSGEPIINSWGQEIGQEKVAAPDYVRALKWYTLAAFHDFEVQQLRLPSARERNAQVDAQERLPDIRSKMSDGDVSKAEKLVAETFERGSPRDILLAADMFRRGAGVEKDNTRAYELYLVASERGVKEAARALEQMRDGKLVSKKDIESAENAASVWQPPLPEEHTGQTKQMAELDRLKKELEELRLEDALAAVSDIDVELIQQSLRALGFYFGPIDNAMGQGTREAIRKFQYSQVKDDTDLTPEQRRNAETGVLSARDTVDLFAAAAGEADHDMSQYVYGIMHVRGIGVEQDGSEAVRWLEKAAGQNLALAHYALGVIHRDGTTGLNPVRPDKAKAALHFAKARALGYAPAGRALELLEFETPSRDR